MARKKASPPTAVIEAVLWHDSQAVFRQTLETSPCFLWNIGAVVYDGEDQIILASDFQATGSWLTEDMDFTKIPKSLIVTRLVLGEVKVEHDM